MVVNMYRIFIAILSSYVFLSVAHAGVTLSTTKVMLGEPIILVVTGKNVENDFTHVDKPGIKKHFEIYDVQGDSDRLRLV
jgi:hypothetical protein